MGNESIANSIAYLAKHAILQDPIITSIIGTVKSLQVESNDDGTTTTYAVVSPLDINLTDISYVQLSASDDSLTDIPIIGSRVTVNLFDSTSGYIGQFGTISQKILAQGTQNYGGLTIVGELTQKLNNLENTVNDLNNVLANLLTMYNAHVHTSAVAGSPTTVPTVIDSDTVPAHLTATTVSDIENPVVVHGNGSTDQSEYQMQLQLALNSIQAQQIIVKNTLDEINLFKLNNPGQDVSQPLQNNYQQQQTILQNKIEQFNEINQNPPQ